MRFRKTQDERDRIPLEHLLDALSPRDTLSVVRAFSYFSQLSNIAEDLHRNWPFFRGLLSNMDMVLSKTDMGIASRYAELVPDETLRGNIFGVIETEWQRTVDMLFAITGATALLQDNPTLARSLATRTPYIDPLNHLQVTLLQRHRAGDNDEKVKRAIHLTINGIAAGLRNSG